MKLTELILQLHTIMLEKGNLDVYVHNDMIPDDPTPTFYEGGSYMAKGVYLN